MKVLMDSTLVQRRLIHYFSFVFSIKSFFTFLIALGVLLMSGCESNANQGTDSGTSSKSNNNPVTVTTLAHSPYCTPTSIRQGIYKIDKTSIAPGGKILNASEDQINGWLASGLTLLLAVAGDKPSGGYHWHLGSENGVVKGEDLTMNLILNSPPEGVMVTMALTNPCMLLGVNTNQSIKTVVFDGQQQEIQAYNFNS